MDGDNANVWEDIEIMLDPDPFYTSCQIYTIDKNYISKTPLKPMSPFNWMFMDIIPAISSKI